MANIKALGICGSLRAESWNLKLLRNFLGEMKKEGFETTLYPSLELPLVNEDLEKRPLPPSILDFRNAIEKADVVVVSSPEYNGSLSSALKNAIDWATRPPANLWAGKIVVILGSSPGAFGAVRGAIHLRAILSGIKAWVIPEQVLLPFADKGFDAEGKLTNESTKKQMSVALESLKKFSGKML
jgi:chromate reductase